MAETPIGYLECPDEFCDQIAEIEGMYLLESTEGPVRHIKIACVLGHRFNMPEIRNYGEPT